VADVDAKAKPTDREAWLRLQASIRVLETYQKMGKPYDVLFEGAKLRAQVKGTVEELIVLSLMYHAHRFNKKDEDALRVRDEMRDVFTALPSSAFKASIGDYSRAFWQTKWFSDVPPK
jgi:hypothetical protein